MPHRFLLPVLAVLALWLGTAGGTSAQIQSLLYVLESSATGVKPGTAFGMSEQVNVPAGSFIRVVMPSGKTQTVKGPYSGTAGDLAKGQRPNESILEWLRNLAQTGGSNEKTPGATRSMRAAEAPAPFSWTAIPTTADSTVCIQKGARPELRRGSSPSADRIVVVDLKTAERGDVEFAAGSQTAPWPASITLRPDGEYVLLAQQNRPRRQLTLRVLDRLPGEEDLLAELAANDCKYQFDAWVKQKVLVARPKTP